VVSIRRERDGSAGAVAVAPLTDTLRRRERPAAGRTRRFQLRAPLVPLIRVHIEHSGEFVLAVVTEADCRALGRRVEGPLPVVLEHHCAPVAPHLTRHLLESLGRDSDAAVCLDAVRGREDHFDFDAHHGLRVVVINS